MARIRSIKPEFFTSLTIADLPLSARLTFIGLWCYVDDNGVGIDDARLIRAAVWPLEEAPDILQRTREDLQKLQEALLITRYTVSGKAYIAVRSWSEHQKVSHPGKPRYPTPEQAEAAANPPSEQDSCDPPEPSGNTPEDHRKPPEILAPEQGAGSRDRGSREAPPEEPPPRPPARSRATSAPDRFPVTDRMQQWARERGIPADRISRETERFLDHHRAKGSTFRDWNAAWRTWMSRSNDFAPPPQLARSTHREDIF